MLFPKTILAFNIVTRRFNCTSTSAVRIRFAPSPTGFLHIGSLRTAFYNYLFAKKFNGQFILRIEDTDQTRLVPESVNSIVETLNWANLKPDEGPYFQSKRKEIHSEKAFELIENGFAYRCFCTETRLKLMRKEALKNRQRPGYDGRCRHLTENEINSKLEQQIPFAIRFKLKEDTVNFTDIVYGEQNFDPFDGDSDPVILKSDGYPTYHLANVVDDHLMNISHVLRGVEWLSSTAKHIRLYEAFNWQPPKFAHLPLLLNKDGSKLSKRQNDIDISTLRETGYLPEALINYLRSIGGGFDQLTEEKIFSLDELAEYFQLERMPTHSGKLDTDKLNHFNKLTIKYFVDKNETLCLIKQLRKLIYKKYGEQVSAKFSDEYLNKVLIWSKNRLLSLTDLLNEYKFIWIRDEPLLDCDEFKSFAQLDEIASNIYKIILETSKLEEEKSFKELNEKFKIYCKNNNLAFNKLMKFIRICTINNKNGPPIGEIVSLLGNEEFLERLNSSINHMKLN